MDKRYTQEFKNETVKLITKDGYSIIDVVERLGLSEHRIYKCIWL